MSSAQLLLASFGNADSKPTAAALPSEVQRALKAVSKKDDNTKLRGYTELFQFLQGKDNSAPSSSSVSTPDFDYSPRTRELNPSLAPVLSGLPWARLWLEFPSEPRVRSLLAGCLKELLLRLGRHAGPIFSADADLGATVAAVWLLLLCDESNGVSQTARGGLQEVFPVADKRKTFFKLVRRGGGRNLLSEALNHTDKSLAEYLGIKNIDDTHRERVDSVVATSIRALTELAVFWTNTITFNLVIRC